MMRTRCSRWKAVVSLSSLAFLGVWSIIHSHEIILFPLESGSRDGVWNARQRDDQGSGCRKLLEHKNQSKPDPLFPKDLFSNESRRKGAVLLHLVGMTYTFVALAITCDEFFVPSLEVIIEKMNLEEDVAGATFMAAGGSAPELFTSAIGVFVSFDDVGIGTIVGSAVFNIQFVIGVCALLSKGILHLTWWPLFRDCTVYCFSLSVVIVFFTDNQIDIWESVLLLLIYAGYVTFMAFNARIECHVKQCIKKIKSNKVDSVDNAANESRPREYIMSNTRRRSTNIILHSGSMFRQGVLHLLINTIDPLNQGKPIIEDIHMENGTLNISSDAGVAKPSSSHDNSGGNKSRDEEAAEDSQPLSMAWPSTWKKRVTYLCLLPITFPLWMTLPDTRTAKGRKFFFVTFLGSILWIAIYSYLMVWWASTVGETISIPPEVMGLTFLAAGTSIPDLITSVIVARKGFGDMAVSSSVGSNIFDITVGLPLPWFLYGLIHLGDPIPVQSKGMVCSVLMLVSMLILVFISIIAFGWKMNRKLGLTMFIMYFIFVTVSLLLEYNIVVCPKL